MRSGHIFLAAAAGVLLWTMLLDEDTFGAKAEPGVSLKYRPRWLPKFKSRPTLRKPTAAKKLVKKRTWFKGPFKKSSVPSKSSTPGMAPEFAIPPNLLGSYGTSIPAPSSADFAPTKRSLLSKLRPDLILASVASGLGGFASSAMLFGGLGGFGAMGGYGAYGGYGGYGGYGSAGLGGGLYGAGEIGAGEIGAGGIGAGGIGADGIGAGGNGAIYGRVDAALLSDPAATAGTNDDNSTTATAGLTDESGHPGAAAIPAVPGAPAVPGEPGGATVLGALSNSGVGGGAMPDVIPGDDLYEYYPDYNETEYETTTD
ncbi:uncharacterized protein LOC119179334 [Rhipicephalus microplus]|uniref:uncharacterized protein LOC119179334 n=1 Tax=Rhipicephalus microplus TaxID=6941 RepID=UPI003F6CA06F